MEHGTQAYARLWYVGIHHLKILLQMFSKGIVFCYRFIAECPGIGRLLKKFSKR